ncbi:MAG: LysM peptidoglycan-binding domain-containing protein [Lachnospiraceae bacterium]|nr:LysM peptidoglycan-binding domain-containing protein [Lachnospiraceae bacterium]
MEDWSYNSTIAGSYTGAKVSYTIPDTEKTVTKTVGKKGRMYEASIQVSSEYDAELKAEAIVNKANKKITTMTVKIMANPKIVATSTVEITGLGKLNGKYYVDQVKHSLGSGYTMTLTLHLIQPRIGSTVVTSKSSSGGKYIVKRGDNLWMLAKQFYGSGTKQTVIYEANKEVIEATAKAHGFSSSQNGHWIFPGTELVIP